jgi:hypothetical protein
MKMNGFWGNFEEDASTEPPGADIVGGTLTRTPEEPDQDSGLNQFCAIPVQPGWELGTLTESREGEGQRTEFQHYLTVPMSEKNYD